MNEGEARVGGNPGHAKLLIGSIRDGTQDSDVPEKAANQEIGDPGWHSRGYLPHLDAQEVIQHVTFHLADSLPKDVLARLDDELKSLPVEKQAVERRKRVEAWIDAGHGSCILRDRGIARLVQQSLLFFDGQHYCLLAWVVMPNHVHVLFQTIRGYTVAKIVASWKKFTARGICDRLRDDTRESGVSEKAANQEIGGPGYANLLVGRLLTPVWHREYWDRFIRDDSHFQQTIEYIHLNPVKAGLVAKAEDWPWSSAAAGHANLLIGSIRDATQESGLPEKAANQEIGVPGVANREIGDPGSRPNH